MSDPNEIPGGRPPVLMTGREPPRPWRPAVAALPLVPEAPRDAQSQAFEDNRRMAVRGLTGGTRVLESLAQGLAGEGVAGAVVRKAVTDEQRGLGAAERTWLEPLRALSESAAGPLEAQRREAGLAEIVGALQAQKAVLAKLAGMGAPLPALRAAVRGQLDQLYGRGLMAGDRAAVESAWLEELAAETERGRQAREKSRQEAQQERLLGGLLTGALGGVARGRTPDETQAAALEQAQPGLGAAAAEESLAWAARQDAILGLVARTPVLQRLKTLGGQGAEGLYRRLLVSEQRRAGVPEGELRIWDRAESDAAVATWVGLAPPSAPPEARAAGLVGYARDRLAGLPAALRPLAVAELQRRGLPAGDAAALTGIAEALSTGRDIAAQGLAHRWAAGEAMPGLTQVADTTFLDGHLKGDNEAPGQSPGAGRRPANPGDPWPAGPETDTTWRAATPLPDGQPRDERERAQIGTLLKDLADGGSGHRSETAADELGIYFENDQTYSGWLRKLGDVVTTGEPYSAETYVIDAASAQALLRQQAKIIKDGGQPSIPGDQVLKDWSDLNAVVRGGRSEENLPLAADLLEHFLEGSGKAYTLPLQRLFQYERFRETVEGVQRYFTAWIRGDQRPSESAPLEELYSKLYTSDGRGFALADGESITISSKWERETTVDLGRGFQLKAEYANAELKDISAALGAFEIAGEGSFTFTREGDRIKFKGDVTYRFADRYNFNPGDGFSFEVGDSDYDFTSERINATQEFFGSAPFDLAVNPWSQSVTGDIVIGSTATRGFPAPWIENLAWDKPAGVDLR